MKNIILIVFSFFLLVSCGNKVNQEAAGTEGLADNLVVLNDVQLKNANIKLSKLEKRELSSVLKLTGKIDVPPQNMISVSIPFGGFLKATKLLPGMKVKKGEVLASIEDEKYIQLQQDYLTSKSKLIYLESEFNRQRDLNLSKATSDKVFQQIEMEFKSQKIAVSALAEKLRLINVNPESLNESNLSRSVNIYSPIEGFVSKVNANIGKYVNPSDVLFELINPEDIHLNLKVFEKDLDKLFIGQKLMAYNNNDANKRHSCEVILISQDLSEDRSAEVHCHFEDYDKNLFPGMYMNAEIKINLTDGLSINDDAIVSYEGKDFVFVAKGPLKFEMLEIIKGVSENGYTSVKSGSGISLSSEQIVSNGAYTLLMQLKNEAE